MLKEVFYKKNEMLEIEFFENAEFIKVFDFKDVKNLYIQLTDGDIAPLLELHNKINTDDEDKITNICIAGISSQLALHLATYIVGYDEISRQGCGSGPSLVKYYFFNDDYYHKIFEKYCFDNFTCITPNLSKYIPEDNAVLFLEKNDCDKYEDCIVDDYVVALYNIENFDKKILWSDRKKITIFLLHGTQSEFQKANEVAKELNKKYGVKEVNLFVLRCFVDDIYNYNSSFLDDFYSQTSNQAYDELVSMDCKPQVNKTEYKKQFNFEKQKHIKECYINKIITTNSTGILEPQHTERLQVIDCKELFEEYLEIQS